MSDEGHEELSPLHRLMTRMQHRMEVNQRHADRHPDAQIRENAAVRIEVYRILIDEIHDAITEVALTQVDRVVAKRVKEHVITTKSAIEAMKPVV